MKKRSISLKMFFVFLAFVLSILLLGLFLVRYFLQDYYEYKKIENVKKDAIVIQEAYTQQSIEDFINTLYDSAVKIGGNIAILDSNGNILYMAGERDKGWGFLNHLKLDTENEDFLYNMISQKENFEFLVYGKELANNEWIIYKIPFYSIIEAVEIIQGFYWYIILIAVIVSILLALLFSKMVTRPLIRLNYLAKQIQKLNFSVKYEENREDEIGNLGRTFNVMTKKLQETIGKLQEQLEKEKSLDKLRKQFVAQVSHELQTPISVIQGYAEGLSDGIVEDEKEKQFYYDVIQDETNKISKMIRELLDLSQLESGTFKINQEPFDLIMSLEKITKKYRKICNEKKIALEFDSDIQAIEILGDRNRIEQVVTNFLNNAIKHTKEDGLILIKVLLENDNVNVSVYNTGKHIPQEELPYIWNSFYKDKDAKDGTGLGLAIAKSILELHKSQYYVENVEAGVKFGFKLKTRIYLNSLEK